MTAAQIPLAGNPEQFAVTLADTAYVFRLTYADTPEAGWLLDILDGDEADIVCGIPLLPRQNLLDQYEYLNIGGEGAQLRLVAPGDGDAPPTFDNLGDYRLIFTEGQQA